MHRRATVNRPPEPPLIREASFTDVIIQARAGFDFSVSNFLWKQATFFAERLVAEATTEESVYLLALANFHQQEYNRAQWLLQGNRLPEARYLLAKCFFLLRRWDDAEEALLPSQCAGFGEVVNGAAGLFLLGQIKEKQMQDCAAVECYSKCLELCPFMWEAWERWSWLHLSLAAMPRCQVPQLAIFTEERLAQATASLWRPNSQSTPTYSTPVGPPLRSNCESSGMATVPQTSARSQNVPPRNQRNERDALQQQASMRKEAEYIPWPECQAKMASATAWLNTPAGGPPGSFCLSSRSVNDLRSQNAPPRNEREVPHHVSLRRNERHRDRSEKDASRKVLERVWPETAGHSATSGAAAIEPNHGMTLAQLLQRLGHALFAFNTYQVPQALQVLDSLPKKHYQTGYVLELVGRSHFEMADYRKAEEVFKHLWQIEPLRTDGLEVYAATLWHLRKEVELGFLSQLVLQGSRLKPQVWCVVGNCFSLQKEHDTAIKFFKRAIQLDPSFVYAYTLCGHEFVANEKFDKAVPMYEHALSIDKRHYNAWWGLGNIYHRQEEYANAKYHFQRALQINKSNSVLHCYFAMVLDALNEPRVALAHFEEACQREPQNGMACFHKACTLMGLERYEEALADLHKVQALAPKEACVHFQLGRVYMRLQDDMKALLHLNMAMDLNRDSKDHHTIKAQIERLQLKVTSPTDGEQSPADAALLQQDRGSAMAVDVVEPISATSGQAQPLGSPSASPPPRRAAAFLGSPGRPGEAPHTPAVPRRNVYMPAGQGGDGGRWSGGRGAPPYLTTAIRGSAASPATPATWQGMASGGYPPAASGVRM